MEEKKEEIKVKKKEERYDIPKELWEEGWQTHHVKVKKLSFGDEADLTDEVTIPNRLNPNQPIVKKGQAAISTVLKSVIEAPWKKQDVQVVRSMDRELADWLAGKITSLNSIDSKKKETLNEPLKPTQ